LHGLSCLLCGGMGGIADCLAGGLYSLGCLLRGLLLLCPQGGCLLRRLLRGGSSGVRSFLARLRGCCGRLLLSLLLRVVAACGQRGDKSGGQCNLFDLHHWFVLSVKDGVNGATRR
jgi:hypothetical protein